MRSEDFDKRVKRMLDQREIMPSLSAWENLEKQLDQSGGNPGIRPLYRYMAAAVVAALLILGGGYWLSPSFDDHRKVAGEEVEPAHDTQPAETLFEEPVSRDFTGSPNRGQAVANRTSDFNRPSMPSGKEVAAGLPSREKEVNTVSSLEPHNKLRWIPPLKDAETLDGVTDEEIDALLTQARAALAREQNASGRSLVSASALLEDVEEELDQNFKDKALEALKKGVVKFRAAVAQGNQ